MASQEESHPILGADLEIVLRTRQVIDMLINGEDVSALLADDELWPGGYRPLGYMGAIPAIVEETWKKVETRFLVHDEGGPVRSTFPNEVFTIKMKSSNNNVAELQRIFGNL